MWSPLVLSSHPARRGRSDTRTLAYRVRAPADHRADYISYLFNQIITLKAVGQQNDAGTRCPDRLLDISVDSTLLTTRQSGRAPCNVPLFKRLP